VSRQLIFVKVHGNLPHRFFCAILLLAAAALISAGCGNPAAPKPLPLAPAEATLEEAQAEEPQPLKTISTPGAANFVDVTGATGIKFTHTDGGAGTRYLVQTVAAGVAVFDYNGDGFPDIYFLNGAPVPGSRFDYVPRNRLYRNNGDWTFTDVTGQSNTGDPGYGLGVATADYDNDGDQDIYISNFGPDVLYRNNGNGVFTDVTQQAGVASDRFGAGVAFVDVNNDGHLDLYVANYVKYRYADNILESNGASRSPAGPARYPLARDQLFLNNGDSTFKDVSKSSGVESVTRAGMGLVCADIDDDADTDIFVCSDVGGNLLLQNDGAGNFVDVALSAGVAFDRNGKDNGSMGASCGDFNGDGRLDLAVTTFTAENTVLFQNLGGGMFTDVSARHEAFRATFSYVTWGAGLADFDHDQDQDLYLACGYLHPGGNLSKTGSGYKCANFYFENHQGVFTDVSRLCGPGLGVVACSKGAAFDDLDNDGDLDAVIVNMNGPPTILRNDLDTQRNSVQISLRGAKANRDGVGARISVVTADKTQIAEVHRGQGYQSSYGDRVHFGLGQAEKPAEITVRWPGGRVDKIVDPPAAKFLRIYEGGEVEPLDHHHGGRP